MKNTFIAMIRTAALILATGVQFIRQRYGRHTFCADRRIGNGIRL
ncbi:hypothetical protein [Treponema endosymbiont of Eucomonympha sp.]|nr:hypothetical protein [Treponema endosymbiont of Eucomonympha sp.]